MKIIEEIGGEFGTTVRFTLHENKLSVKFFAAEIISRSVPDGTAGYSQSDDTSFENAERYVEGWVKWDGCSHVSFGDENAQLHLCGKTEFEKLANILRAIYRRCGEIMKEAGSGLLDGEF